MTLAIFIPFLSQLLRKKLAYHLMAFFFCFGVTTHSAQWLFLALHSEIVPGNVWGTIWDAKDQIWVDDRQDKHSGPH